MTTTQTGIPIVPCKRCGLEHPTNRTHCPTCGIPSLFGHDTHGDTK